MNKINIFLAVSAVIFIAYTVYAFSVSTIGGIIVALLFVATWTVWLRERR